ncbi:MULTISPECIES: hypothetical protein [Niastella]|uniref:DoxX family protein n=1 Tax=Niastella soli TaxID=2821487 RepID=A0ABS3YT59_9BACT|nr:hypothetical protein [Niastella soli]MBO9201039.1 hypothetical protein [Niastella soli]
MSILNRLRHIYYDAKGNKWFYYFAIFCRVMLALGFIPSGIVKVMGERFASGLSVNHPLGHYLEALHSTGYYYTFIGITQLIIAVLLLIPRTALLGALMYFPIILNICVLTYAVRFEGTRIVTLMTLANLYLLCWDYDRIKYILPFKRDRPAEHFAEKKALSNKFPLLFFASVIAMVASVIVINHFMYNIRPGNSAIECTNGCAGNSNPKACLEFCDCIHRKGKTLNECLVEYNNAKETNK